jgi:hypothetical protein
MTTGDSIGFFIFLFILFGIPMLGIFWVMRAHEHTLAKRDEFFKRKYGDSIRIYRTFPIPAEIEEVVQGGLHQIIQRFRELIVGDTWLFIQPTFSRIPILTITENRNASALSLFSLRLENYSPTFVIRNRRNRALISRYFQTQINNNQLVRSELDFDTEQSLFAEQGKHVQALQIMSPELLIVLKNAPASADIIIKKNQLYYILPGEKPAEDVLDDILAHSKVVAASLEDNLRKWALSEANKAELEKIKESDLAVTLREMHEASRQ